MEENHTTKIKNNSCLFEENIKNNLAVDIDPHGHYEFFGDQNKDSHSTALERYFREWKMIYDFMSGEFPCPDILNPYEAKEMYLKDQNETLRSFEELGYANYLIKKMTDEGHIFIKDYTTPSTDMSTAFVYVPLDLEKITPEQRAELIKINDIANKKDIKLNIEAYDTFENAADDRPIYFNMDDLITKKHQL